MAKAKPLRFVVEPVQTGDLRAVMRLSWRTTSHLYPFGFFEEIAKHQREYFRVVREVGTGRVLAFLIAAKPPGRPENCLLLCVDPAHKGKGLRRALLHDVAQGLVEEGARHFTVEVGLYDKPGVNFFRKEGFEVVGVEEGYAPEFNDRFLLSKPLRE